MKSLIHNGVYTPPKYEAKGMKILFKNREIHLSAEQEEMAVAWVKKFGTDYVKDKRFCKNFLKDFSKALGLNRKCKFVIRPVWEDFDFGEIIQWVEREKEKKANFSKEEKKALAAERKLKRETLKEKYGYAIVDGETVEISNYVVEPPCIFMGRGKHPLRGRWKGGADESDIILNLSPDAPMPEGNWKERVWQPNSMWIAKWDDKLRRKEKYVWFSESSKVKQRREIEKFNQADALKEKVEDLQRHIRENLDSEDITRRKLATTCYLIDVLNLRVGDEKEKDEADTVGATTLRPQHIKIMPGGLIEFDFIGKDSVRWQKTVPLPHSVVRNLEEFISTSGPSVFEGIRSDNVKAFLSEVVPGLTAKVFRTHHASRVVKEFLKANEIDASKPDYVKKYIATVANLKAAEICNHKRKLPKNWHKSMEKKKERLKKLKEKKTKRSKESARKLRYRIKAMKETRNYNLGTSLKSYIDPRIYYNWGKKVDFDWKLYYPKTLQRKFSWVEDEV